MKKMQLAIVVLSLLLFASASFGDLPGDSVGDERDFWIWDLSVMPPVYAEITATCTAVGNHAYVYVENVAYGNNEMTTADSDTVLAAFEDASPAGSYNPAWGIYQIEEEFFGIPGDVDSDPKVRLLFYNLACYGDTCFDGYFNYEDLLAGPNSNLTEMIHLNIHDALPTGDYMLGIIAHEYNHLIHTPIDPMETMWFSEAVAESAMVACGYGDDDWFASYLNNTSVSFWGESEHSVHYGAALVMGTYLYEKFGADLSGIISDTGHGLGPIEDAWLDVFGETVDFMVHFSKVIYNTVFTDSAEERIESLDFTGFKPTLNINEYPFSQQRTAKAGAFNYADFGEYASSGMPFVYMVETEDDDVLYVAMGNYTADSSSFDEIDLNTPICVSATKDPNDGYAILIANGDEDEDGLYTVKANSIQTCEGFDPDEYEFPDEGDDDDDDDSGDDDDDVAEDDDDDDSADDDDDDDGGCGC